MDDEMKEILKFWNLSDSSYEKVTDTTWKIEDNSILKRNNVETEIRKNISIISALKEIDFPVPNIIKTIEMQDFVELEKYHYMMTEILRGEHLNVKEVIVDEELGIQIGQIIAQLQTGLRDIGTQFDFRDNDLLKEFNGWIKKYITTKGNNYYASEVFDACFDMLTEVYPKLKRQPIHRDVHMGNMLFENKVLTGYIDFDISQIDARLFDLAYMGVGALVAVFEDNELRSLWPQFIKNLTDGFSSVTPLDDIEVRNLILLMGSIEILFVAYYLSKDENEQAKSADETLKWLWESEQLVIR